MGIPDKFFSICDSMIINTLAEINMIPVLVMACRLCPKNYEGYSYQFLFYSSIYRIIFYHLELCMRYL